MPLYIYHSKGHASYDGEQVSQLEHAVQSAEHAQALRPTDTEFILAAFFHDIGHLLPVDNAAQSMGTFGVHQHELRGAEWLRDQGFSEKICRLVAGHVQTKRYLVSTDTAYFNQLSEASKVTLQYQGGPMSPSEMFDFETDDLIDLHIALRRIDEKSKIVGLNPDKLDWINKLIIEHRTAKSSAINHK